MPEAVHDAVLEFEYDDGERARIVERSVRQEIGEISGDRTKATISRDGCLVELTVLAEDLVALRAGVNTWLTLVSVAERCSN
ncbi:KEOPS complex subunit Pcc1 [Halorientalis salina]|uniref:KEOPS complex subunit Pcc1 n=1 Tax=Halorientalis salina TaxID=2932266 RepID=UPI0010AB5533|nr:KEOPS complex subunit Pcc1 [Halorientalis salina]